MKWKKTEGKDCVQSFLASNGLKNKSDIERFLNFSKKDLRKTYKDLDAVVEQLIDSLNKKEKIVIYGDYDADGINATVISLRALKRLGADVDFFINDRFIEGYGLNVKGMEKVLSKFPDVKLIFTCDNGIAAQEGIKYALDRGIKVVCSDHHRQKGEIIVPTVDEWRDDEDLDAREECCGAEIARRVMMRLYEKKNVQDEEFIDSLLAFSGIATVTDSVKFTAANHYLVKETLKLLKNPPFAILKLMLQILEVNDVDEETIGFSIGPLFNAMSRVNGSCDELVNLLMEDVMTLDTYDRMMSLVANNNTRKEMTTENLERAKEQLNPEDLCIVLAGKFDPGIAGLVASNVVEEYSRPCICLNLKDGIYKGSARTFEDFDLKEALDKCADLLLGYGGHAGAAGLSLSPEKLDEFKDRMNKLVKESGILDEEPCIAIDYETSIKNVWDEKIEQLLSFAPFGMGFRKPNIAYYGSFSKVKLLPTKEKVKKHVMFELSDEDVKITCCWWNAIERWTKFYSEAKMKSVKILGCPKIEEYNGDLKTKISIQDIKMA